MTAEREWFVDANLLVLLVVGQTDRSLIAKHKRLSMFDENAYDLLTTLIAGTSRVCVTPNTLTEASNLIGHHREPERSRCYDTLGRLIEESNEVVVESITAARNRHFRRLGLSDAVLMEVVSPERPLLTVDLELYLAALATGDASAVNFQHCLDPPRRRDPPR